MNCLAGITGGWFLFQAKKGHPLSPQNYFCLPLSSAEFSFLALGRPAHELTLFLIINIRFSGVRVFYTIRVFKCFVLFGLNFRTWRSTLFTFGCGLSLHRSLILLSILKRSIMMKLIWKFQGNLLNFSVAIMVFAWVMLNVVDRPVVRRQVI